MFALSAGASSKPLAQALCCVSPPMISRPGGPGSGSQAFPTPLCPLSPSPGGSCLFPPGVKHPDKAVACVFGDTCRREPW